MSQPRIYQAIGIVIKRKNVGEADRVLTIFTRQYGKIRVIAKGIRKITSRRAGHLELFQPSSLIIHKGKTWDIISGASQLEQTMHSFTILEQINACYYISELIDVLLPERVMHADVYELYKQTLLKIAGSEMSQLKTIMERFSHELLVLLGFMETTRQLDGLSAYIGYIERIIERYLKTPRIMLKC